MNNLGLFMLFRGKVLATIFNVLGLIPQHCKKKGREEGKTRKDSPHLDFKQELLFLSIFPHFSLLHSVILN
jgi:hypothetical protein